MQKAKEENLVLPAYRCANKPSFLCDLIAFVFFIKGQCPSFKEVETEVKLLLSSRNRPGKQKSKGLQVTNRAAIDKPLDGATVDDRTPAATATMFTCYASPVECKVKSSGSKAPLLPFTNKPLCGLMSSRDELRVAYVDKEHDSVSMDISFEVDISKTFDHILKSAKKSFGFQYCHGFSPKTPIVHIKRNVHQERMLRCLAEVVPAVLLAAPNCDAIMLAFGHNLLALEHAVLLEFAPTTDDDDDEDADAEEDDDFEDRQDGEDDDSIAAAASSTTNAAAAAAVRQRQLVFSRLLGVSGLADALPLTSMHVLLRSPCSPGTSEAPPAPPPPPPFRPRPQFRLRPSCQLTRLTLPFPAAKPAVGGAAAAASASASAADSLWFHSATPVPGYALPDRA